MSQVLGESLRPLLAATAAGTVLASLVLRSFRNVFYGVSTADVATFSAACLVLLAVASVAAFLPSRRAAGVDAVEALRGE